MTFSLSRMASAEKASKDSAQSPAWSRNASPLATLASSAVRLRASPANTSGGRAPSVLTVASSAPGSAHAGCWAAVRSRHDEGDQVASTDLHVAGPPAHGAKPFAGGTGGK